MVWVGVLTRRFGEFGLLMCAPTVVVDVVTAHTHAVTDGYQWPFLLPNICRGGCINHHLSFLFLMPYTGPTLLLKSPPSVS